MICQVLEGMDWQAGKGEMYEGIMVNDIINRRTGDVVIQGNPDGKVAFGEVGPHVVEEEDEIFIVIAPQSMVITAFFRGQPASWHANISECCVRSLSCDVSRWGQASMMYWRRWSKKRVRLNFLFSSTLACEIALRQVG